MATITYDPNTGIMSLIFVGDEIPVVSNYVSQTGTDGLLTLLNNFIQISAMEQIAQERMVLKKFVDQATPDERAAMLNLVANHATALAASIANAQALIK